MLGTCYPCHSYVLPSLFGVRGNVRRLEPLAEVWILNKFADVVWKGFCIWKDCSGEKTSGCRKQPGLNNSTFTVHTCLVYLPQACHLRTVSSKSVCESNLVKTNFECFDKISMNQERGIHVLLSEFTKQNRGLSVCTKRNGRLL